MVVYWTPWDLLFCSCGLDRLCLRMQWISWRRLCLWPKGSLKFYLLDLWIVLNPTQDLQYVWTRYCRAVPISRWLVLVKKIGDRMETQLLTLWKSAQPRISLLLDSFFPFFDGHGFGSSTTRQAQDLDLKIPNAPESSWAVSFKWPRHQSIVRGYQVSLWFGIPGSFCGIMTSSGTSEQSKPQTEITPGLSWLNSRREIKFYIFLSAPLV